MSSVLRSCNVKTQICVTSPHCVKFKYSFNDQIWNMFCDSPFEFDNSCMLYQCDAINIKHLVLVSGFRDVKVLYHFVKKSSVIF